MGTAKQTRGLIAEGFRNGRIVTTSKVLLADGRRGTIGLQHNDGTWQVHSGGRMFGVAFPTLFDPERLSKQCRLDLDLSRAGQRAWQRAVRAALKSVGVRL